MVRAVESHFHPNSKSNCAPSSSARHSFGSNGAFLNFAVHVTKDREMITNAQRLLYSYQ